MARFSVSRCRERTESFDKSKHSKSGRGFGIATFVFVVFFLVYFDILVLVFFVIAKFSGFIFIDFYILVLDVF